MALKVTVMKNVSDFPNIAISDICSKNTIDSEKRVIFLYKTGLCTYAVGTQHSVQYKRTIGNTPTVIISCILESHSFLLGLLYGGDLLCHHRQHFHINTVKLVKAGPGTRTTKWKTDKIKKTI